MEDPKGYGRQFVVSKAGVSHALSAIEEKESFLHCWQEEIKSAPAIAFPTIRELYYMAYEAGSLFEKLPEPKSTLQGPIIWRHQPQWSICFDSSTQQIHISSTESDEALDTIEAWLQVSSYHKEVSSIQLDHLSMQQYDYQHAVERVKEYILAGDIFQANIARFWQADCDNNQLATIYESLRSVNSAPFSCFVRVDDLTIISASPERLFAIDPERRISARPIAGTRKRSEGESDDAALADELLLSEKERAEHIMLVDLERNDLGRVCMPGSVEVNECMVIEKYATVQHIVSNVTGKLRDDVTLIDVLRAKFPGGTITGCPKVRCMEIIHELEPVARGPYTGGVGYTAWDGSVDMNILIRTFWHENEQLHWAAGAGIVADSVSELEEIETEHKVAGLMRVFA